MVHYLLSLILCFESVVKFQYWSERLCPRGEFPKSILVLVLFCIVEVCFQAIIDFLPMIQYICLN